MRKLFYTLVLLTALTPAFAVNFNHGQTSSGGAIISSGTPIYPYEHYVDDRWYGTMNFVADPSITSNCNVRIESKQRK